MGKGKGKGEGKGGNFFSFAGELGREIVGCICFCACIGPILLFVGLGVLLSATQATREDAIKEYNTAVDLWTSTYRAEFAVVGFNATNGVHTLVEQQDTSADKLLDTDLTDFKTYEFLKYRTSSSDSFMQDHDFDPDYSVTLKLHYKNSAKGMEKQGTLEHAINPMTEKDLKPSDLDDCDPDDVHHDGREESDHESCSSACSDKHGTWNSAQEVCVVKMYAVSVCFVISIDNKTGVVDWSTLYDSTHAGCAPDESDIWNPVTYDYWTSGALTSLPLHKAPLYTREENDPYVVAAELTDGTYRFGLSRVQKAKVGMGLLVAGGIFTALTWGVLFAWLKRRKRNRGQIQRDPHGTPYGYQAVEKQQPPPQQQPTAVHVHVSGGGYQQPGYPPQQPGYPPQQPGYPPQQPGYPPQQPGYPPQQPGYPPQQPGYPPQQPGYPPQQPGYPPQQPGYPPQPVFYGATAPPQGHQPPAYQPQKPHDSGGYPGVH